MGRGVVRFIIPMLVAFLVAGVVRGAESEPSTAGLRWQFGAEASASSSYLWRGLQLSERPVLQPSVWLGQGGLTVSAWTSFSAVSRPVRLQADEIDLTLEYETEWQRLGIRPSVGYFVYPASGEESGLELGLELGYPAGVVSFTSGHWVELLAAPGAYFGTLGVLFEYEPMAAFLLSAELKAGWGSFGFNRANLGLERAAVNCLEAELALTRSISFFYLQPQATLCWLPDREVSRLVGSRVNWSVGMVIGWEM